MLRIAICGNDKKQQSELLDFIARDVNIDDDYTTECFFSAIDVKTRIGTADFHFDLLFLMIDAAGIESLALAEFIRECKLDIDLIFIADTVDFVSDAFRCKAFNYIVKPVDFAKFSYEMQQYLKEKQEYQKGYFPVSIQGREQMLPLNAVLYFTSNARKIGAFFSNDNKEVWFYGRLDELEKNLKEYGYLRCHQSYLINGNKIEGVNRETIQTAGGAFPIGRKYREEVKGKWEEIKKNLYGYANIDAIDRMPSQSRRHDGAGSPDGNSTVMLTKSDTAGPAKYGIIMGIRGERQNASFRLYHGEEAVIGRDAKQCHIVVNDSSVSRKHCVVRFDREQQCYFVCDSSKNGTLIGSRGQLEKDCWIMVERGTMIHLINEQCSFLLT